MKYLLSTGKTTSDTIEYIKDLILINMLLRIDEIPYWNGGSDELITSVETSELQANISSIVNKIISNVVNNFNNVTIQLKEVNVSGTSIQVQLTINNIEESYDIKRGN